MSEKLWIERGKTYLENFNKKTVIQRLRYMVQEQVIIGALNRVNEKENINSIVDAGCGFGRITGLLCEIFPYSKIVGIDISEDQLRAAQKMLPRVMFWKSSVTETIFEYPNELTVAVELLMHIEPEKIEKAIQFLTRGARGAIITVDWWTENESDIRLGILAGFCYLHDYEELFRAQGFELVREKKIPFVQQKLRVWRRPQ